MYMDLSALVHRGFARTTHHAPVR